MRNAELIKGDIVFNAKPDAVPYNYRISYKVSQICLIMRICGWCDSCSLVKLQMISCALLSDVAMDYLTMFSEGKKPMPVVRFDPAVNLALTYGIAYGFITQLKTGSYKLTTAGHNYAERIKLAGDIMVTEITRLNGLSRKLTEKKIKDITDYWEANNATY